MFKDLSLESRNIQTQNCAPIQCTVYGLVMKCRLTTTRQFLCCSKLQQFLCVLIQLLRAKFKLIKTSREDRGTVVGEPTG